MKYNAKQFYNDLRKADKTKLGNKRRKKNKKAYSSRDINDAADEFLLVAENLSEYYEKKDARGAVEYARKQWLSNQQKNIFSISKEASKIALKDLIARWKEEGHI